MSCLSLTFTWIQLAKVNVDGKHGGEGKRECKSKSYGDCNENMELENVSTIEIDSNPMNAWWFDSQPILNTNSSQVASHSQLSCQCAVGFAKVPKVDPFCRLTSKTSNWEPTSLLYYLVKVNLFDCFGRRRSHYTFDLWQIRPILCRKVCLALFIKLVWDWTSYFALYQENLGTFSTKPPRQSRVLQWARGNCELGEIVSA